MNIYIKQHDKDSEMLELFSVNEHHGRNLTTVWCILHSDFIDDPWIMNLIREGNTVQVNLVLERLKDDEKDKEKHHCNELQK